MPDIKFYLPSDLCVEDADMGRQVAAKWGFVTSDIEPEGLALTIFERQVQLKDYQEPKQQGIVADFLSGSSQYRQQHGGGKKEPIAKAVGVKGDASLHVVDATPGLGRDAFVLAAVGCQVTMIERSAVVAAILEDGLRRLQLEEPTLASRFTLLHGNSIEVMQSWNSAQVDSVYLDPMFPHKKKSALVKKEMRVFQQLLGADSDADALLAPALNLAQKRVVVKRPNAADALAQKPPSMAIESKKHRFDVYLCNK
ncbi:class I SAM-dependent methyltransferase [Alteromonas pelagimontana]|uniref:Ribosomal RNA small subunit methyltransferase J n=1 Tax=Alteromonas pelagimontana TaxID=1858656 RepID=A0A6M4ME74_9ALTE|nr:class I SAM-dependent methyltransferase [Alteromonas pelagimontana]QJR81148.1 class I SAM-dependent methyltransferase [Alteromonas pelagimontana]